jgi:hypothetical protein
VREREDSKRPRGQFVRNVSQIKLLSLSISLSLSVYINIHIYMDNICIYNIYIIYI